MPTKTQRILGYLPPTFRPEARNSVLRKLVNTFGVELLNGENSLSAVMAAHWVDHADRGAAGINDLARLGALYSLLPRDDETVEEFREHLKRYVRTFIEGTVTVRGLLRVSAEALNLHIADQYDSDDAQRLDTWWTSISPPGPVYESRWDDAAIVLFGFHAATSQGDDNSAATTTGSGEIPATVDTRQYRFVNLSVDGADKVLDLLSGGSNPASVTREEIIQTINAAFEPLLGDGVVVARLVEREQADVDSRAVELRSPTTGTASKVAVRPLPLDKPIPVRGRFISRATITDEAAETVLGFVQREAFGTSASSCSLTTDFETDPSLDLTRGIDLREQNLLSIAVDDRDAFQVDCAGPRSRATSVAEVVDRINTAAGSAGFPAIASAEGRGIKLTSPTPGPDGNIRIRTTDPREQNASERIFGGRPKQTTGAAAQPATIIGQRSISQTVDLSERARIRLSVNSQAHVDINVAGSSPAQTSLDEIIEAINAVYPNMAARTDQNQLRLAAPDEGTATRLAVLPLRQLELIEYPPIPKTQDAEIPGRDDNKPRHGDSWEITNTGVCDVQASIEITSPSGTFGPTIINHSLGCIVRVLAVISSEEGVRLWTDEDGYLQATHFDKDGNDHACLLSVVVEKLDNNEAKFHVQAPGRPDATILTLPQGTSLWSYADCHASRFDFARFASEDASSGARFAGGQCLDRGIIDASPFEDETGTAPPPNNTVTVFASESAEEPGVDIRFGWNSCETGAFVINLPSDLPERFGGRFNQARFGKSRTTGARDGGAKSAEPTQNYFQQAVTEPAEDPNSLLQLIPSTGTKEVGASLVTSSEAATVQLGFNAEVLPFREPKYLTGGNETQRARIYLFEEGRAGFVLLEAKEPGVWGNQIYITAVRRGPATYEIAIDFDGARFECARSIVMGAPVQSSRESTPKPGTVGILQAKAAGIHADVTRYRAELDNSLHQPRENDDGQKRIRTFRESESGRPHF